MTVEHGILFVACLLVASGLLMRRAGRRSKQTSTHRPIASGDAVVQTVHATEARLYDFRRETEATIETRLTALRVLTEEADRAAARLETALDAFTKRDSIEFLQFDEQAEAARSLIQAGYSDEQVSKLLDRGNEGRRAA